MGQNSKYYGILFDRRSQNFGFHMIARSQLIADDRRGSQRIAEDRTWFYLLQSSAIVCDHDRRRSQTIAEVCFHMIADDRRTFCDLRSAIRDRLRSYENQPLHRTALVQADHVYLRHLSVEYQSICSRLSVG